MVDLKLGDCLELMKDIPDNSIDMVLTDPPYGTTQCKWDSVIPFDLMWEQIYRIIKTNSVIAMFGSEPFSSALRMSNIKNYKYDWIWKKPHTGQLNSHRMPLKNFETISIFYTKQCIYNPQFSYGKPYTVNRKQYKGSECYGKQTDHSTISDGRRFPTQILEYGHDKDRSHPTQKPTALLEYLIRTYTNDGGGVLDFTMGSGSTGVACVNTGRNFIGIELDENYFNTAVERIHKAQINNS